MYTREELEQSTVKELRAMCRELGITGVSKALKATIIDRILENSQRPIERLTFEATSVLTNPRGRYGQRITTESVHISCGASSGNFPVVGKTVGQVADFLKEVLNIDEDAISIVNGNEVDEDYVLQRGETLEFLKKAGRKG